MTDINSTNTNHLPHIPLWESEQALARLGGNQMLLNRILAMFLAQIDVKHEAFNRALAQDNLSDIQFISHAIKGVAGDVGASALHAEAAKIESLAKSKQLTAIHEEAAILANLIAATVNAAELSKRE